MQVQVGYRQVQLLTEQRGGAQHQIGAVCRKGEVGAGHRQAAAAGQRQGIVQSHGLHDGGHIVVPVVAAGADDQRQVHLGGGVKGQFHSSSRQKSARWALFCETFCYLTILRASM